MKHTIQITHNSSTEQFLFFPKWVIDHICFRADVNQFIIINTGYRINQYYLNWVNNNPKQVIITSRGGTVTLKKLYSTGATPEFFFFKKPRNQKSTSFQNPPAGNFFLKINPSVFLVNWIE